MIVAAGLILGATLLAWLAPSALRRITSSVDPATAMCYWLVSIAAVLGTFAVGVGLLLLPGDGPAVAAAAGCWTAVQHGQAPELDEAIGAAGLIMLLLVVGRFVRATTRRLRSQQRIHRAHLNYLTVVRPVDNAPAPILWLDYAKPLAYSLAGRPGLMVASTGLKRLPTEQVTAVLCHERAHLRGRHHLLTSLTEALARAVPVVPLFRQAPAAVRLFVELAADAAAVRACGPHAVRAALLALNDSAHAPDQALAMAHDAVPLRLRQITPPRPPAHVARQALSRTTTALALAALPGLFGLSAVMLAAALSCTSG